MRQFIKMSHKSGKQVPSLILMKNCAILVKIVSASSERSKTLNFNLSSMNSVSWGKNDFFLVLICSSAVVNINFFARTTNQQLQHKMQQEATSTPAAKRPKTVIVVVWLDKNLVEVKAAINKDTRRK